MELFEWKQEYSVGIPAMDAQHQQLISLINSLYDAMSRGAGKAALGSVLADLERYTETHFRDEELLMEQHGYPFVEEHKVMHETMAAHVKELNKNYRAGNAAMTIEVMVFLKSWLEDHILKSDKEFSLHLDAKLMKMQK
jgi:hemerythrin-like metal-binding protein